VSCHERRGTLMFERNPIFIGLQTSVMTNEIDVAWRAFRGLEESSHEYVASFSVDH